MSNITRQIYLTLLCLICSTLLTAQNTVNNKISVNGSMQSDILIPEEDARIGTGKQKDRVLTNTYAEVNMISRHIDAGIRMEYLEHPLPGFENDFKGWGLGNIYARLHTKDLEITLGNFYEQFGSGFILRTYEERSLGIDNSMMGAHIAVKPLTGITIKALTGRQRHYWNYNRAQISGGDMEINIEEWWKTLQSGSIHLSLGASYINKHEKAEDIMVDATHRLNLPLNVNAFDLRAHMQHKGLNILAEYAQKSQDPSFDNGYTYGKGYVTMLSVSYSKRGMSMLLQAKRSENMSFRSRRSITGTSSFINHMPAFTLDHTYTLAAHYPYATNPDGEWAYQAALGYKFGRGTLIGGKYGTNLKINLSYIRAINKNTYDAKAGTDGNGSAFWKWGDRTYYQDLNIQMEKKLSKDFTVNLMYMNQFYNKSAVEGEGGMIHSDIFIAEGKYRMNKKITLRTEAQYLSTKDDQGDWAFGLLELSILPCWMITVSDEYNCGTTDIHYYSGMITFNKKAHRLQLGYGRTRAGYNCAGGVCRYVPASKGLRVSYNYNF